MATFDDVLGSVDNGLRTLWGEVHATRPMPQPDAGSAPELNSEQRRLSAALMRVNHVGEVCAQALYQAQALTARTPALRSEMQHAAREETDHLAWTSKRLEQLGGRTSYLNPLWYAGAFGLGLLAGRLGDRTSLGFVVETERQVEQHLADHLDRLPENDLASRAMVQQMKSDEAAHADAALAAGGAHLPAPARWAMRAAAKLMTTTAHFV
jgi:3-demethoxyubiquinol 3-hydroxylase